MSVRVTERNYGTVEGIKQKMKGASVTVGIHSDTGDATKQVWGTRKVTNKTGKVREAKARIAEPNGKKLIDVAIENEFGINTPERSFLRAWVDDHEIECREKIEKAARRAIHGGGLVSNEMARFGAWAAGQVKRRIIAGISPALSARRKLEKAKYGGTHKDTPLIFTAQLLSSIMSRLE